MTNDLLTIGEAAIQLGVSQSRVRRALSAAPEYAARTQQVERPTRTGMRMSTALPLDLVWDLQSLFALEVEPTPRPRSASKPKLDSPAKPPSTPTPEREGQLTPAEAQLRVFYERLDSQRQEQIADLRSALEHERGLVRSLADSLAREQSLRLFESTQPAPDPLAEEESPAEAPTAEEPLVDQADEPPPSSATPSWEQSPAPEPAVESDPPTQLPPADPPKRGLWRRFANWLSDEPTEG